MAALAPFEPRRPLVPLGPSHLTLLEAAAAVAVVALAWTNRRALAGLVRRLTLPVAALGGFAAASLLSAALAAEYRAASVRFALRMGAMALAAAVVAAAGQRARRPALAGLALGGLVMAALVIAEAAAPRTLEPLLSAFREARFSVGGTLRASGPAEHPNLAAAWIAAALVAGSCLLGGRSGRRIAATAALSSVLAGALLLTYSRGALLACAAGLAAAALAVRRTRGAAGPATALAVLAVAAVGFAGQGEVFRLRLATETATSWYGATYAPADRALRVRPGEVVRTRVAVTNTGRKAWTEAERFHLSCHWYDTVRRTLVDGPRAELPGDVPPGGRADVPMEVTAPEAPGDYLLVWDMVQEDASWFSGQGVLPATVPVTVGDGAAAGPRSAPAALPLALGWRATRADLWRAALVLWRAHPWLGVGPDNFRRLYGAAAGHPGADTRVFANNLLLETGADTGLLGAVLLVLALAAALWRTVRTTAADPATAAALAGLLTLIVVHGLVDFLLAFTGQYLLLAMVVGLAAAPPGPVAVVDTSVAAHYAPGPVDHGSAMRRRAPWIAAVAALAAVALAALLLRPAREGRRSVSTASCFVPTERVGPGATATREVDWTAAEDADLVGWNPWTRLPAGAAYRAELILYDPAARATVFVHAERSGGPAGAPRAASSLPPGTAYRVRKGAGLRLRYTLENAGSAELSSGGAGAILYLAPPLGR